jgi:Glycosyl hydrolase family 30 beta sandwich domain
MAEVSHAAFENLDGQGVIVLANSGPARTVQVQLEDQAATVPMSKNSVATLVWQA